ncbi:MAG: D-glycerate dehydrogenase [Bacillota bacterium]
MTGGTEKKSIYITRKIPQSGLSYLEDYCDCRLWDAEAEPVPREVLLKEVASVKGLYCMLSDRIDAEVIDAAPHLEVISTMAVGYDHIDIAAAARRGITVTNTPGVLTETTADLAFALMMAVSRRLIEANRAIYQGGWKTWAPLFMAGRDIFGASLGIIGLGRIGQAMARRARGFNMKVCYYSRTRREEVEAAEGIVYLPLDELLQYCDFISLHVPANEGTFQLIGIRELNLMKPTAVLINTARGSVVDEEALFAALISGQIHAAGLDVFAEEPISLDHPLLALPNVVALPHIGSASVETRTKMARIAAGDMVEVLAGRPPRFPVPGT